MKAQSPSKSLGEGRDVAPSLAHPSQKQNLVVYTEDLTHLWRTRGWIQLPKAKLYEEFGLVNLISLIPSLGSHFGSRASS